MRGRRRVVATARILRERERGSERERVEGEGASESGALSLFTLLSSLLTRATCWRLPAAQRLVDQDVPAPSQ